MHLINLQEINTSAANQLSPEVLISILLSSQFLQYGTQSCDSSEAQWRMLFNAAAQSHTAQTKGQIVFPQFNYAICPKCGEVFTIPNTFILLPANFHCSFRAQKYNSIYSMQPMHQETVDLINNILKTKGSLWQTKQTKTETAPVFMMK